MIALAAAVRDPPICASERTSRGYVEPFLVYMVEYTDSRAEPGWTGQVGAFSSLLEAEKLRDRLNAEGGWGEVLINTVAIHSRFQDYEYDR